MEICWRDSNSRRRSVNSPLGGKNGKKECVACGIVEDMGHVVISEGEKIHCCLKCYESGKLATWFKEKGLSPNPD